MVVPGIVIGEEAFVAAGAVVTRDVDPFTIVAGAPAKKVGERERQLTYRINFAPWLQ